MPCDATGSRLLSRLQVTARPETPLRNILIEIQTPKQAPNKAKLPVVQAENVVLVKGSESVMLCDAAPVC
jgi:hypothetical protein